MFSFCHNIAKKNISKTIKSLFTLNFLPQKKKTILQKFKFMTVFYSRKFHNREKFSFIKHRSTAMNSKIWTKKKYISDKNMNKLTDQPFVMGMKWNKKCFWKSCNSVQNSKGCSNWTLIFVEENDFTVAFANWMSL